MYNLFLRFRLRTVVLGSGIIGNVPNVGVNWDEARVKEEARARCGHGTAYWDVSGMVPEPKPCPGAVYRSAIAHALLTQLSIPSTVSVPRTRSLPCYVYRQQRYPTNATGKRTWQIFSSRLRPVSRRCALPPKLHFTKSVRGLIFIRLLKMFTWFL